MSFLPQDYQAPRSAGYYLKLQDGENRIRILSKPILGWEDWDNKKPIRYKMNDKPPKPVDPKVPLKHFWAFIVFNYKEEEIQILHLTQATIRKKIEDLYKDSDWGIPFAYDIKIFKSGEKMDTEYSVNPVPHKPVDSYILQCFKERPIYLEALFTSEDPFSGHWSSYTLLGVDAPEEKIVSIKEPKGATKIDSVISETQFKELDALTKACTKEYQKKLDESFDEMGILSLDSLPAHLYERIKIACIKNKDMSKVGS